MQGERAAGEGRHPDLAPAGIVDDSRREMLDALSVFGGTFDWLADEPDIYSAEDGEPIL